MVSAHGGCSANFRGWQEALPAGQADTGKMAAPSACRPQGDEAASGGGLGVTWTLLPWQVPALGFQRQGSFHLVSATQCACLCQGCCPHLGVTHRTTSTCCPALSLLLTSLFIHSFLVPQVTPEHLRTLGLLPGTGDSMVAQTGPHPALMSPLWTEKGGD